MSFKKTNFHIESEMIKEIGQQYDSSTNDFLYPQVKIKTSMCQPFSIRLSPLDDAKHYAHNLRQEEPVLLEAEPSAGVDWFGVSGWLKLYCVSSQFKEVFNEFLVGHWIATTSADHYLFIPDNIIDGFSEGTVIKNETDKPYWYDSIENESFNDLAQNQYLFSVPNEPVRLLSTSNFEDLYRKHGFKGIQFFKDINFTRSSGKRFDGMRFGRYDDEGNYLGR